VWIHRLACSGCGFACRRCVAILRARSIYPGTLT
jgi:hypothetical protein